MKNIIRFLLAATAGLISLPLAIAQDAPMRGAEYFQRGANTDVYKLPNNQVQKIYRGGPQTRDLIVELNNLLADRNPTVPRLTPWGQNSAIQNFVNGKSAFELLHTNSDAYLRAIDLQSEEVSRAHREIGVAKFGTPLPFEQMIEHRNGIAWKVDSSMENFRFTDDGRIAGWYDGFFVRDAEYTARVARTLIIPTPTGLPVESLAPSLASAPPDKYFGLTELKAFTFLNLAVAGGDIGLSYVDYTRALVGARTQMDKDAVNNIFMARFLNALGIAIGGTIVVGIIAATAPYIVTAGVTLGFLGLGVYGFGTHLNATFGNNMLDFLEQRYGEPDLPNDVNHPRYKQMRQIQKEELQLKLKEIAAQRPGFNGVMTSEDLQRLSITMDPAFAGKEVNYGGGTTRSQIIAKENQLFALYADIKQTLKINQQPATMHLINAKRNEAERLKAWLVQTGANTGLPVRLHNKLEQEVGTFYQLVTAPPPPPPPPPVVVRPPAPAPYVPPPAQFYLPPMAPSFNSSDAAIYSQFPSLAPISYQPPINFGVLPPAPPTPVLNSYLAPGSTFGPSFSEGLVSPGRLPVNLTNVSTIGSVTVTPPGVTSFTYFDRYGNVIRPRNWQNRGSFYDGLDFEPPGGP